MKVTSAEITRNRKKRNDKIIAEYKSKGCVLCGYNRCLNALDFHHVHGNKTEGISQLNGHASIPKIKREIEKCVVVCANCHREIHAGFIEAFKPRETIKESKKHIQLKLLSFV